ncbi:MAG: S8 family serine peptidase, partial [Actinomycetota bacterium]
MRNAPVLARRLAGLLALAGLTVLVAAAGVDAQSSPADESPRQGFGTSGPESVAPGVPDPGPDETVRVVVDLSEPTPPGEEPAPVDPEADAPAIAGAQAEVEATLDAGSDVISTPDHVPTMAVEATAEGLSRLRANPLVADVRPDLVARPLLDVSTALVNADDAWPTADGSGHSVAIVDTGVQPDHPFLDGKVVYEACFANDDTVGNSPAGDCPNGQNVQTGPGSGVPCTFAGGCFHGTHVAGIAAGADATFDGVARGADVLSIQVFHDDPLGELAYFSDIVDALDHLYTVRSPGDAVEGGVGAGR